MAAPDLSRPSDKRLLGYRFAGVVLDLRRQALVVDGEDVASTPLMLRLLQMLCAAEGQLLKRQDIFDKLWPGGQEVSESSLSQLVWRLRGALGPYGECVATVRGSGLRLDAPVSTELDFQRAPRKPHAEDAVEAPRAIHLVEAAAVVEAAPAAIVGSRNRRSRGFMAGGVAVLLALALAAWFLWPRDSIINVGYALNASDLHASRAGTAKLVGAAFNAENAGERSRAKALMQSAHQTDPTTPVPAIMLAWWTEGAATKEAQAWLDAAHARINAESSPYLRLFCDYFTARTRGESVRGPLNALIDLRPQAWYLQYSSAHEQLGNRELAGALRSLQQIPLDQNDSELLAEVVTDRISLGDHDAKFLATSLPAINQDPVAAAYVRGRAAYSRGDLAQAMDAFDRCRTAAGERREYAMQRRASEFGALAALESDSDDAAQRIDATIRLCHDQDEQSCETEMLGLQAFAAVRAGRAEAASSMLANAWAHNPRDYLQPPLLLVALENGLPAPGDVAATAQSQSGGTVFGGVSDLLLGWDAFVHGDTNRARQQLALAREHGIAGTYHAEDALLLAARLGEPPGSCRMDPPYPNSLRLGACIVLRDFEKMSMKQPFTPLL
jgi:DNA-binding winged helix-turn-helix (wHTH) protein/tetratricopeptide (TPR) repeat protein